MTTSGPRRRREPAAGLAARAVLCALALGAPEWCAAWSARLHTHRGAAPPAAAPRTCSCARARRARPARGAPHAHARPAAFNGTWPRNVDVCEGMTVRLFPGYAQQLEPAGSDWHVSLRGWVCDSTIRSARRRLTSRALQRGVWTAVHAAGDAEGEHDAAAAVSHPARSDMQRQALLRRRVSIFLTKSHARRRVAVALTTTDGAELWSSKTNSAGHFTVEATVPQGQLLCRDSARQLPGGTWLTSVRTTPSEDGRVFETALLLIPPVGLSVISDIDDTIKQTHVHNTRLMLRSTFLEEWLPVPGMPDVYREWASHGAAFHYVSSSPWQLQPQLEALLAKAGFPPGTFHLKDLHYKGRRLLNLFRSSTALKPKQISGLLDAFPRRRFVLVGDSGEKDAQIYAQIARHYRERIVHIYIRNVPTKQLGATSAEQTRERLGRFFRGLPDRQWTVFDRASCIREDAKAWPQS
ncbi:hypothetical protein KFE25_008319 [Diacronema lutheri]|uniref:Phosphatidate phosphatase APP1 catalytic domain-containing protein n=1 Tax=Diacronema lutheri TaxID=2081491 RepID=A0A8J6CEI0_DIALT|nr:hypothetical protein KFE25_008319 [Diacronema lutheri]